MPEQQEIPPPPKKHEGIFSKSEPQQGPDLSGMTAEMNTLSRRLRLLEESVTNMRRFFQVTEENAIERNKHFSAEIKTLTSDIGEIRKEIQEIKDKLMLVIKELQTVARKEEVRVLEKYINLWNPVKFVSQNEIESIINEVIDKREKKSQESK